TAMDRVAEYLGMDRLALRQHNLIRADQFPYLIPAVPFSNHPKCFDWHGRVSPPCYRE
ncbi:MAG: hypothetical protein EBZ11_05475, partial [Alphaproteobacteria bacterium]|nr:hypothetical protein [Alphaproteobacteria bacterium]